MFVCRVCKKMSLASLETVTKGSRECRSWLCCLLYVQVDSLCHIDYYWSLQAEGEETFQISTQSENWFRLNDGGGFEYHHGDGGEAAGRPSLLRFWEIFPYQRAGAWPAHELLTPQDDLGTLASLCLFWIYLYVLFVYSILNNTCCYWNVSWCNFALK